MAIAGRILVASLPVLLSLYVDRYRQEDLQKTFVDDPPDLNLPVEETYDFIIVGGGGAGCVVARRLSDAQFKVLLLEAGWMMFLQLDNRQVGSKPIFYAAFCTDYFKGGDPPPLSNVPLPFFYNLKPIPGYLSQYTPVRQKYTGLKNISDLRTVAARVLGGGTSVGGLIYERGNPRDYENWAEITGDSSWLYKNVLKYFRKHEDYMGNFPLDGEHSQNGPMGIEQPKFHPVQEEFLQAGRELGFEVNDPNGPNKIGFSPENIYTRNGRRQSTYLGYIKPIEKTQEYLTIYRYSAVSKVLFEGKRAIGVEYKRHGVPRVAFASKEVILSAGPYTTPIVLIKSGIGPRDQLEAANVQPLSIRPVGYNFMNHLCTPIQIKVERSKGFHLIHDLTFTDIDLFLKQGEGPLASSNQVAFAYLVSSSAKQRGEDNWPDLHIAYSFDDPLDRTQTKSTNYGNCLVRVARPMSRGRITYNSSSTDILDPYSSIVNPRYFSDPTDFKVALEGIEFCKKIIGTKAFKRIGAKLFPGPKPKECSQYSKNSRKYAACRIKYFPTTYQNVGGTARMGRIDDEGAVVGPRLKVIGVEGLRVVDSSVIPALPNGQTTAPTIMIAEKTSAEIIQEYSNSNLRSKSISVLRSTSEKDHLNGKTRFRCKRKQTLDTRH